MSKPNLTSNCQEFKDMIEEEKIIATPDEEILNYVSNNPNPEFQKHLAHVKRIITNLNKN